jgi:hypothetical protein
MLRFGDFSKKDLYNTLKEIQNMQYKVIFLVIGILLGLSIGYLTSMNSNNTIDSLTKGYEHTTGNMPKQNLTLPYALALGFLGFMIGYRLDASKKQEWSKEQSSLMVKHQVVTTIILVIALALIFIAKTIYKDNNYILISPLFLVGFSIIYLGIFSLRKKFLSFGHIKWQGQKARIFGIILIVFGILMIIGVVLIMLLILPNVT